MPCLNCFWVSYLIYFTLCTTSFNTRHWNFSCIMWLLITHSLHRIPFLLCINKVFILLNSTKLCDLLLWNCKEVFYWNHYTEMCAIQAPFCWSQLKTVFWQWCLFGLFNVLRSLLNACFIRTFEYMVLDRKCYKRGLNDAFGWTVRYSHEGNRLCTEWCWK